jgi:aryl-alcohol dehydrogenase-like predicted oxidoreductase
MNFFYTQAKPEEVEKAVEVALEEGYRLIDTAFNYNNEEAIGHALRRWVDAGRCRREDLFITTKVKWIKVFRISLNIRHILFQIPLLKNARLPYFLVTMNKYENDCEF